MRLDRVTAVSVLAVAVASLTGCPPNLNDTTSIVSTGAVLAVQASPAEAPPTTPVKYTALVTPTADGGVPRLVWDYCNARNPLSNLGPINPSCVDPGSAGLVSLGVGLHASGAIPGGACGNFGPNAPPPVDGGAEGGAVAQPVDPDATGGYYQPVVSFVNGSAREATLYQMRIACGFAGASEAPQGTLTARYHLNTNPEVLSLTAAGVALASADAGAANRAAVGSTLALTAAWPACPLVDRCGDGVCGADESATSCAVDCTNPKGCAGAERYVNLDIASQTVVDQREGIDVSWYATAGSFAQDRTGNARTDDATTSSNSWTAPQAPGIVTLWVVLHDDRGGIGWAAYTLDVR